MKYAILNYANEQDYATGKINPPAFAAYAQALSEAGVMVAATGLQPSRTATTVRNQNGQRNVQDRPFADTKEQLDRLGVATLRKWVEISIPLTSPAWITWTTRNLPVHQSITLMGVMIIGSHPLLKLDIFES